MINLNHINIENSKDRSMGVCFQFKGEKIQPSEIVKELNAVKDQFNFTDFIQTGATDSIVTSPCVTYDDFINKSDKQLSLVNNTSAIQHNFEHI